MMKLKNAINAWNIDGKDASSTFDIMRNTQKVRIQDSRSRGQKQENLHKEKIGHPG